MDLAADTKRVETVNLADVLSLVLQHSTCKWEVQTLCTLLQVSSGCRQVLQRACGDFKVTLDFQHYDIDVEDRTKLQAFCEWLPRHGGLITTLLWMGSDGPEHKLLQRQLAWTLQLCRSHAAAAGAATAAGGAAAAAGGVGAVAQLVPLQLKAAHFWYGWPAPQLVCEVAAAGLQQLEIRCDDEETIHQLPSYYTCFSTLTNMQRLLLMSPDEEGVRLPDITLVHSAGFLSALQQLTALTSLTVGQVQADLACQLPHQLQDLNIVLGVGRDGSTEVSLSHLTALQDLFSRSADEGLEVLLPQNLSRLTMQPKGLSRITGASSLRDAELRQLTDRDAHVLVHLCSLHGLSSLSIYGGSFSTPAACEVVAAALGSATALTRLDLWGAEFAGRGLCRQLAKLPRLAQLEIDECLLADGRRDCLSLTALTTLTSLRCQSVFQENTVLDDVMAAALAFHLTGLRHLRLVSNRMHSLALLPAVGALTGLQVLLLRGGNQFVVGADDLMLLSGLTKLEALSLQLQCSEAEQRQFLAGMPHLRSIKRYGML